MQKKYYISKEVCDQIPNWLSEFRQDVVKSVRDNAIVGFENGTRDDIIARLIVKGAVDELLIDTLIWISFESRRDWSLENVQLEIIKSLQLPVTEPADDGEHKKDWNVNDTARRINSLLIDKRLLFVVVNPPEEGISLVAAGVPAFCSWSTAKLLIVGKSDNVLRAMQASVVHSFPNTVSSNRMLAEAQITSQIYDLTRLRMFDIASLPSIMVYFTGETVFSCFKSLWLIKTSIDAIFETAPLYWIGEGLLEGRWETNGQSFDLTEKISIGKELLKEFLRQGLFEQFPTICNKDYYPQYKEWRKWKYDLEDDGYFLRKTRHFNEFQEQRLITLFTCCGFVSLDLEGSVWNSPKGAEWLKWISTWEDHKGPLRATREYPSTSILAVRNSRSCREIHADFFQNFRYLRVLDLSNTSISTLPASITHLTKSLRVLLLKLCDQIQNFPSDIQYLECLEILNMESCSQVRISSTTFSFENLGKIQYLNFSLNHHLSLLPQSICSLFNLEQLHLRSCKSLTELPEKTFQHMNKLVLLDLSFASVLHSLPPSISCCMNLKTLLLKICISLKVGVSHFQLHPNLEKLDLSGCCSLQEISTFQPTMPKLQYLNLSGVIGIRQLSLRGCPSLKEVQLRGCLNLGELDLSGTKIRRFPDEVCSKGASLKRLYMLGNTHMIEVNWKGMNQLPRELFYVDECCEVLNSSPSPVEKLRQLKDEAFISLRNNTTFFEGYPPQLQLRNYQRLNVFVSPCEERGIKGKYHHFQKEHFQYKEIYQKSLSPTSATLSINLSPNTHCARNYVGSRNGIEPGVPSQYQLAM